MQSGSWYRGTSSFAPKRDKYMLTVSASYQKAKSALELRRRTPAPARHAGSRLAERAERARKRSSRLPHEASGGGARVTARCARGLVGGAAGAAAAAILAIPGVAALSLEAAFVAAVGLRGRQKVSSLIALLPPASTRLPARFRKRRRGQLGTCGARSQRLVPASPGRMGRSRSRSSSRSKHTKSSKHNKKRSRSRSRSRDKERVRKRSKSRESKRNRRRESRSRSRSTNTAVSRRERDRERASSPPDRIDIFGRTVSKRSSLDEKQKREEEEKKAEFERQRKM